MKSPSRTVVTSRLPAQRDVLICGDLTKNRVSRILRGFTYFGFAALALPSFHLSAADAPRTRVSLDADWRFQRDDPADSNGVLDFKKVEKFDMISGSELVKTGTVTTANPGDNPGGDIAYAKPDFDDGAWRKLNVPHDWAIEGPFIQDLPGGSGKRPWAGIGWYRRHFNIPAGATASKKYFVDFDGAMSYSMVWLNGHFVGGWPFGYASFEIDLSPYLKDGDNVLSVRLENPPDSSRWYPGAGIFRNVWLVSTEATHIAHWGVYLTTPKVDDSSATVQIQVRVQNAGGAGAKLVTQIFHADADGKAEGAAIATSAVAAIPQAGDNTIKESPIQLPSPTLWSPEKPNLYVAVTSVSDGKKIVDSCDTTFGVRTIRFDKDQGFFLNGKHVKLNGVCDHQDLGALGDAINVRALQRQIELLKEMGCNAIRTSHNPPAPELLDLCDKMGMVVMDEFADCWRIGKTPNDYNLDFEDWHEKDLRGLIRRDEDHPCVILWSIGNEIPGKTQPAGIQTAHMLADIAHDEDPTRPVTSACDDTRGGYDGYQNAMDVFGYNYKPFEYARFHTANPDIPLFGSETASCISTRGEYVFPVSNNKADGKSDFQVSSYDLYAPRWATPPDAEFEGQDRNPNVCGEFVWTGFDYIGEPTPYDGDTNKPLKFTNAAEKAKADEELKDNGRIQVPSRSSYFGILDLAGFKKDRFYIYQARWRPDYPMAHILPHWTWPDRVGQVTPVHVYTSGDEAELFLNGKSLGRKKKGQYEYRLRWDDVVYEPGELKVIAYKNGQKWAEDTVKTAGPAAKLSLHADRSRIKADGQDLSYVTVKIADKAGLMVPQAGNLVQFDVAGPADIIGVNNGDPTDHDPFQDTQVKAFNGLALVILRSKPGQSGEVTLHAKSDGLAAAEVPVECR
jgi:beta-galactosidase